MNHENIQQLRKLGNFQEAINQGLPYVQDFKILIQVNWAYYGLIKQIVDEAIVSLEKNSKIPYHLIDSIYKTAREYAKLPNRRADSSLSNILRKLSEISSYSPNFLKFVLWVQKIDGFQDSDWQNIEYQGKQYPSLAFNVARSLAKWANSFPRQTTENDLIYIIGWLENVRSTAKDNDKLWLDWDKVKLLKKLNRHLEAAKVLSSLLKTKRNDFWVWQEAGRLYRYEQPDLAKACYCRALECGAKAELTVNVHTELAQLLAEQNEQAWATAEILSVLDIRQQKNWKIDNKLQELMNSAWYNPSLELPNQQILYQQYAQDALILCFDNVREQLANFAEIFEISLPVSTNPEKVKSKYFAKFIIKSKDKFAISLVCSHNVVKTTYPEGTPVSLTIGTLENGRETILDVTHRPHGTLWDCADTKTGIITDIKENNAKIFFNRDTKINIPISKLANSSLEVAANITVFFAQNPKKERLEILSLKQVPENTHQPIDVKTLSGKLRRHEKGFAFIDDVFISPQILQTIPLHAEEANLIAIYTNKKNSETEYSWRAISLKQPN